MKNAGFWDVGFLQELHGIAFQKSAFFSLHISYRAFIRSVMEGPIEWPALQVRIL
jgi:hypothetical protein